MCRPDLDAASLSCAHLKEQEGVNSFQWKNVGIGSHQKKRWKYQKFDPKEKHCPRKYDTSGAHLPRMVTER